MNRRKHPPKLPYATISARSPAAAFRAYRLSSRYVLDSVFVGQSGQRPLNCPKSYVGNNAKAGGCTSIQLLLPDQRFEAEPYSLCIGRCAAGVLCLHAGFLIDMQRLLHTANTIQIWQIEPYQRRNSRVNRGRRRLPSANYKLVRGSSSYVAYPVPAKHLMPGKLSRTCQAFGFVLTSGWKP